ncbi:hypothetical protein ACQ4LE_008856 [Meloidogyne hapla]
MTSLLNFSPKENRLIVALGTTENNSIAFIAQSKLDQLDFVKGEMILLIGKKRRKTACIVDTSDVCPNDQIVLSTIISANLQVKVGGVICVKREAIPDGIKINCLPIDDTIGDFSGNFMDFFLKPYFDELCRPVFKGNVFAVSASMRTIEFKVVEIDPSPVCRVVPSTIINSEGDHIKREDEESDLKHIGYDDIGGMEKQLKQILEMVESPLRHPKLFKLNGIRPTRGVILFGPSGCGKTMLAHTIENETDAFFFLLDGQELKSLPTYEAESALRRAFAKCEMHSPAILFIDDIDFIAPNRENNRGDTRRRVITQLLNLMDGLNKQISNIVVIGATSRPNAIDPALRNINRFDRQIDIGIPDTTARLDILRIHTKNLKLSTDVDLKFIAKKCHGYVGADLAALCLEAGYEGFRQAMEHIDPKDDTQVLITMNNFQFALGIKSPSALRELAVEVPTISWKDIGGLENVKR